jgi:hypothetical protein
MPNLIDQQRLDEACTLFDAIAADPTVDPVAATWALLAADNLARAGARTTTGRALTDRPIRAARRALQLLASLSFEVFSDDAVLDAVYAGQRTHAAAV